MPAKSRVTAEQTMPTGRGRGERQARRTRPQRQQATQVIHERSVVTEVQMQGGSHDHDDRYPRIGGNAKFDHVNGDFVSGNQLHISSMAHINNLVVYGSKNAIIKGTEHGDLYYAATESDRARFWVYVELDDDVDTPFIDPPSVMARLPDEFTAVTQAPYWISIEPAYDIDGNELGRWARVTADVRDDLGPQQSPFGKGR